MDTISFLQTGYVVCLSLAVMFFIISAVLFFVFDIRLIFNIRTGRAKRKTVEEMQKANSETGRLRANGKTLTSRLNGNNRSDMPKQFSALDNINHVQENPKDITLSLENEKETSYTVRKTETDTNSKNDFARDTSYGTGSSISPESINNFVQTSVLNEFSMLDFPETSLLSESSVTDEFRILEKILLIHTKEIIC